MPTWGDPSAPEESSAAPSAEESPTEARGRRLGRPRGPVRVPLTVRILTSHDERLTAEVALQGLSPQYLVEEALTEYFARLDHQRRQAAEEN